MVARLVGIVGRPVVGGSGVFGVRLMEDVLSVALESDAITEE